MIVLSWPPPDCSMKTSDLLHIYHFKENVDSEVSFKQRELDRSKASLKQFAREEEDLNEEISDIKKDIEEREELLEKKNEQEEQLTKKFKKLISERDGLQSKIRETEYELSTKQNSVHNIEQQINAYEKRMRI